MSTNRKSSDDTDMHKSGQSLRETKGDGRKREKAFGAKVKSLSTATDL